MIADDFSYQGLRAELLYDAHSGLFRKILTNTAGVYKDRPTGSIQKSGYVSIALFGKSYKAHRLAWFYVHSKWPYHSIDHIDGNKANNAICNLREATQAENLQNMKSSYSGSASGLLGVTRAPFGKWMARININGKNRYLGHFQSPKAAHSAYLEEKRKSHAFCTI